MKQYNSWQSYKRLLMFIKPYKMRLVVAVICMALSGASNVVVPWLIKDVIDKVLANKDIYTLNLIVIGILILFLLRGFFYFGQKYLMSFVGQKIVNDIRETLYRHLQTLSLSYFDKHKTGNIMSNLTTGAGVFCATYYWGDGSLLGQFSMMKMFPVIIALAFAPVLIKKTGSMQKVNFWGYAISSVLGIPMIYFAMQKNLSMFLLFMFIKGVFAGTLSGSLNALIAEASGYTTRTTGVHMDGMMYSCSSLGVKVGGGIGTAAVGWLLKLGGFVGTATVQSESAIRMIFNLYITFPFVIGIIITVLLAFLDVEKANKKWDAEHQKEAQV